MLADAFVSKNLHSPWPGIEHAANHQRARACPVLPEFEPSNYRWRYLAIPLGQAIAGRYIGR